MKQNTLSPIPTLEQKQLFTKEILKVYFYQSIVRF